jgi:hypothetical protein
MLVPANLQQTLALLDEELRHAGIERELIICGGGALLTLEVISRETRDIDVIQPEIDAALNAAAERVAAKAKLSPSWLNNGPSALARDLKPGWQERSVVIYQGKVLIIKSLERSDLIFSKLLAMCDRDENDLDDLVGLRPTWDEVEIWKERVLNYDASPHWPARVNKRLLELKKKLKND